MQLLHQSALPLALSIPVFAGSTAGQFLNRAIYLGRDEEGMRRDFKQAAYTFADGYQKFPKSNKAPDNLLKLGMALGQLGQVKEACTAFARLLSNFPDLGNTLKSRIQRQRQRHRCR